MLWVLKMPDPFYDLRMYLQRLGILFILSLFSEVFHRRHSLQLEAAGTHFLALLCNEERRDRARDRPRITLTDIAPAIFEMPPFYGDTYACL